jgi:hypothetical protein
MSLVRVSSNHLALHALSLAEGHNGPARSARHVENMLQDLNEAITNDDNEYFLGTIVLIQPPRAIPSIADGQQRLATVTILLARLCVTSGSLHTGRPKIVNSLQK